MGSHGCRRLPARTGWALPLFLAAVLLAATASLPGPAQAGAVADRANAHLVPATRDGQIPLLIRTQDAAGLAARVAELGGRVSYVFENLDGLSVTLPPDAIDELRSDPRVGLARRQRLVHRAIVPPRLPAPKAPGLRYRPPEGDFLPLPEASEPRRPRTVPVDEFINGTLRGTAPASFFGYDLLTGAAQSWEATDGGEGVIVVIIDTGVYPDHWMYFGNVIGGENLVPAAEEQAIDLDGDGFGDGRSFDWDSIHNDGHGTFVAGLVAGHMELVTIEDDPFVASLLAHSPESVELDGLGGAIIRLAGTAPGASLYGMKAFPYDGSGAPDARIAEGIDRLIQMKKDGVLDTDVINMSLSGPVLHDGWNALDQMVDAATEVGITVVSAASNDGPSLITVGSPASAFTGLAAGGVSDPIHTRVILEQAFGAPPGAGTAIYPHDDPLVVDFAARGPSADHRVKPSLVATAFFLFSSTLFDTDGDYVNDSPGFGFASGTSFSCPTVAGAAALVTAYGDRIGRFAKAPYVANALRKAAVPIAPFDEVSQYKQGRGFVNVPKALELMEDDAVWTAGDDIHGEPFLAELNLWSASTATGATPSIPPGGSYDFFVDVPHGVANLLFEFPEVTYEADGNPAVGEIVAAAVHTAKRGGAGDYVFYRGDPFFGGIQAGDWVLLARAEPGRMRVTISGYLMNYHDVSASVRVTAEYAPEYPGRVFRGRLGRDEVVQHQVEIPEGMDRLAVRLSWEHDWTTFPTYDLDMMVEGPDGVLPVASINSPEFAWIDAPSAGTYTFTIVDWGTVQGSEPYMLEIALMEPDPGRHQAELDVDRPKLDAAVPNPARGATELSFAVPRPEAVELQVFDVSGRLVRTLLDEPLEAGRHRVSWDGRTDAGKRAAGGVYFLRLRTERGSSTRKLTLLE